MSVNTKDTQACFGGKLIKASHQSKVTGCEMTFNLYLPPQAVSGTKVPLLVWLSGLTCNEDNCAQKGFLQNGGKRHGIAVVYPDTSPRNVDVPGQDESYDFGSGAGFYVDATVSPYDKNYKMYSYITQELPSVLSSSSFGENLDLDRVGISGHSMGGHGALTLFLKNPGLYKSVSAVAPISNPTKCPWGEKAFKGYFGEDQWETKGKEHDATELVKGWKGEKLDILIDVGLDDNFNQQGQLLCHNLVAAARDVGQDAGVHVREHSGYTHSYYTVASFADDHMDHHAKHLVSGSSYEQPSKKQKL